MKHASYYLFSLFITITSFLAGCSGGRVEQNAVVGDTVTTEVSLLTIVECDGYSIADIRNPWDTTKLLNRYALVDRAKDLSSLDIPKEAVIVRTPVKSSLVYSSVHAGAIKELGGLDAVTGIADASYFKIPEITDRLKNGKVIDVGPSMNPTSELIVTLSPEIIMASPFQNAGHGVIEQLGIPIIECADYMENSPLGRAEWIKLIGRLYGNAAGADSIFEASRQKYENLRELASTAKSRPSVISEQLTDGVWYLPGGKSYMATMFRDAGASYPWSNDTSTGSLQLDMPTVLDKASDADFWLTRTYGYEQSRDLLRRDSPLYAKFKAYTYGNVYFCDTASSMLYEEFPFHPELLLKEFITIFHPELFTEGSKLRYYSKAK